MTWPNHHQLHHRGKIYFESPAFEHHGGGPGGLPPVPALTEWGGWPVLRRLRRAGGEEREAAPRLSPPPTQIRLSAQGWRVGWRSYRWRRRWWRRDSSSEI